MSPEVDQLERELLALAAQVHAANAALAETLVRFGAADGWHGAGIRSLGHWCDINSFSAIDGGVPLAERGPPYVRRRPS